MFLRQLLRKVAYAVARVWFTLTFIVSVLLTVVACRFAHLLVFLSKRRREKLSAQIAGLGFRAIFAFNPQISIEHVGEEEPAWEEMFSSKEGSSPIVLINHTSQLDSLFYSACIPIMKIQGFKTLAKSTLFNLPVFGHILRACGHFPVYFAKETMGDFSVDRDAQERVQKLVEDHVEEGGGLSLFPEGQINRANSRYLQNFRRGSLQLARKKNMQIWGFLHSGVDKIWPASEAIGGVPGTIRFKLFKIPTNPNTVDIAEYVTHIEKAMQLELDLMHALDEGKSLEEIRKVRDALHAEVMEAAGGNAVLEKQISDAVSMESK
jgi:1-acyl-sn-glycerol-3-phosphate acyltransferase